jgi:hypothetical protein
MIYEGDDCSQTTWMRGVVGREGEVCLAELDDEETALVTTSFELADVSSSEASSVILAVVITSVLSERISRIPAHVTSE